MLCNFEKTPALWNKAYNSVDCWIRSMRSSCRFSTNRRICYICFVAVLPYIVPGFTMLSCGSPNNCPIVVSGLKIGWVLFFFRIWPLILLFLLHKVDMLRDWCFCVIVFQCRVFIVSDCLFWSDFVVLVSVCLRLLVLPIAWLMSSPLAVFAKNDDVNPHLSTCWCAGFIYTIYFNCRTSLFRMRYKRQTIIFFHFQRKLYSLLDYVGDKMS